MDELKPASNAPPASNPPTVRQGCSLIAGGAALGFFGCLGAIGVGSDALGFVFLGLGAIVILWGTVKVAVVIWKAMSRPL